MLAGLLHIALGEMSLQVRCPFSNQVVHFVGELYRNFLYILDIIACTLNLYPRITFSGNHWATERKEGMKEGGEEEGRREEREEGMKAFIYGAKGVETEIRHR